MNGTSDQPLSNGRPFSLTLLLPVIAICVFAAMIVAGETQIRRSPKWPPPAQHELGGWEIDDPPVLDWAAGLNLPASLPIFWIWEHNDSFMYALDDHQLIIYVPWLLLVYGLWYFVAYRIKQITNTPPLQTNKMWHVVTLVIQILITFEVVLAAIVTTSAALRTTHAADLVCQLVCSWAWLLVVIIGWAGTFARGKQSFVVNAS